MYNLYNADSGDKIGTLSAQQLFFLVDHLEEETPEDKDYYINVATLDMFESEGADAELMSMLRNAMGDNQDMDIRWDRSLG